MGYYTAIFLICPIKTMRNFKRGNEWPNEGFVQHAIEIFFKSCGFFIEAHKTIDLVCYHPVTSSKWRVESKGLTTAVGVDFRTGLGQLIQGMIEQDTNYGLAIPDIPQFRRQVHAVPSWVAKNLAIHWIYVQSNGSVFFESAHSNSSLPRPASDVN